MMANSIKSIQTVKYIKSFLQKAEMLRRTQKAAVDAILPYLKDKEGSIDLKTYSGEEALENLDLITELRECPWDIQESKIYQELSSESETLRETQKAAIDAILPYLKDKEGSIDLKNYSVEEALENLDLITEFEDCPWDIQKGKIYQELSSESETLRKTQKAAIDAILPYLKDKEGSIDLKNYSGEEALENLNLITELRDCPWDIQKSKIYQELSSESETLRETQKAAIDAILLYLKDKEDSIGLKKTYSTEEALENLDFIKELKDYPCDISLSLGWGLPNS